MHLDFTGAANLSAVVTMIRSLVSLVEARKAGSAWGQGWVYLGFTWGRGIAWDHLGMIDLGFTWD